jgi:hypothetical protein
MSCTERIAQLKALQLFGMADACQSLQDQAQRRPLPEEVPKEVVLKFCDKNSSECERARQSVLFGKPSGKAPFIKRCYNAETLLGQEVIQPTRENDRSCQLIIFAIGDEPITGYVQYGWGQIINDNSVHGPLRIA